MTPPSPWRARTSAVAGGGAALAAALIVLWLAGRADPPPGLPSGGSALTRAATAPSASASGVPQTTTRLPVDPHTAADPFLTPDLRYQIEAMLLDAGDATTPEELKLRLSQLVRKHFGADLATRALALAERYVDYRVALGSLRAPQDLTDPRALRDALEARHKVRLQFFDDAEYDALFAREADLDRYTLARLEIERNTQLSPEQRAQALQAADNELSAERRAERSAATQHMTAAAQTAAFNASNADERTRYAARSAQYGPAAAQAMAQLDREEQHWNQRLDQYSQARAQQGEGPGLQQLRQQLFSPDEQQRIDAALALRRLNAGSSGS